MHDFIASRYDQFLKDLETLVNIDSGSDDHEGVLRVAEYLKARFDAAGLRTQIHHFDGVPCLEAVSSDADTHDFLFVGHMDTVFLKGEAQRRPFRIEDGKGYGPGSFDMKAGLLTALHTVEALKESGDLDKLSIRIAFNGDEETGSFASKKWIMECARTCRRVFIFEPCRMGYEFVLQRKGGGAWTVRCHGETAHAGGAPEAPNPLMHLAGLLPQITAQADLANGTSVVPTVMYSGTPNKNNVIPDLAVAEIDVRFAKTEEMHRMDSYFKDLAATATTSDIRVEVTGIVEKPPMVPTDDTYAVWDRFVSVGEKLGLSLSHKPTGGCSDGNYTASLGVPTVDGLGGMGAGAHAPGEYVELSSLTPLVTLAFEVCRSYIEE